MTKKSKAQVGKTTKSGTGGAWRVRKKITLVPENGGDQTIILSVKPPSGPRMDVEVEPAQLGNLRVAKAAIQNRTGCTERGDQLEEVLKLVAEAPSERRIVTFRSGRRGAAFVMPSKTLRFSRQAPRIEFCRGRAGRNPALGAVGRRSGNLRDWKQLVAVPAGYSSIGMVVIGAALSPSLCGEAKLSESFILNLAGRSSTGKSLMTIVAMSVQGEASRRAVVPPDLTERAFEEAGVAFNELLMPIDDLNQVKDAKSVRATARFLAYHFCDGGGRTVSDTVMKRGELPFERFSAVGLVSFEESSSAIAKLAGVRRRPGETVRMFDLPVDQTRGVFDRVPTDESRPVSEIIRSLEAALCVHYGVALPEFLKWLHQKGPRWRARRLGKLTGEFVERYSNEGDGVTRRAAQKFGLIYAALVMARSAGITPWSKREVRKVMRASFLQALSVEREDSASISNEELVCRLQDALKMPGAIVELSADRELPDDNGSWVLVRGISTKDGRVDGLRLSRLESIFPHRDHRSRLLEELANRGVISRLAKHGSFQP